jgi:FkbM family methyltransferase
MKFLFVARQERHAAVFIDALQALADRGHAVALAVQESEGRARRTLAIRGSETLRVTTCPSSRIDEWAAAAALERKLRDCLHYLRPPFRDAPALQQRFLARAWQEMDLSRSDAVLPALNSLRLEQLEAIEEVLALAERAIPTSRAFDEFLRIEAPDVLLVCPFLHLGPSQADVAASARRLGIPVWMILFSWDNLSTKGSMHVVPDRMFVWNEQQRQEAARLHGFPRERCIVVGALRFDAFFARRTMLTREQFLAPLDLDPQAPTLLYLCSSALVSPEEIGFVVKWLKALRESSDILRGANVIVRPHPANSLLPMDARFQPLEWPAARRIEGQLARPFDDPRAVVVQTPHEDPGGLYESLAHSEAVVALNTTAELEAGIVGRPVFTIQPETADGGPHQATLHFHYLTREHGGFVSSAPSLAEHIQQLERALTGGDDAAAIQSFVQSFLRPHGLDRPVLPILVEALESAAAEPTSRIASPVTDVMSDRLDRSEVEVIALGDRESGIMVHATAEAVSRLTDHGVVRLDTATMKWLNRRVGEGDVVYDIYADFGPYSLVAARQRRARVVAFEPGHRAYAALCDNLQLNQCEGAVVPVPLPIGSRDGLADVKRRRDHAGRNAQAYCWSRLDTVVERYELPPVNHLRLSNRVSPFDVLDGAEHCIACAALRTIWLEVALDQQSAIEQRLRAHGFALAGRKERRKTVRLLFVRLDAQPQDALNG